MLYMHMHTQGEDPDTKLYLGGGEIQILTENVSEILSPIRRKCQCGAKRIGDTISDTKFGAKSIGDIISDTIFGAKRIGDTISDTPKMSMRRKTYRRYYPRYAENVNLYLGGGARYNPDGTPEIRFQYRSRVANKSRGAQITNSHAAKFPPGPEKQIGDTSLYLGGGGDTKLYLGGG